MMYQQGQQLGLTSTHKFNLVAGVILPAIAITVEATTNLCAQLFFDPVPTSWHLLLVLLVPLAQLHVWFAIRRNDPSRLGLAGVANAFAIAVSLFYSVIYLPLLPFAALTLLIAVGLLPLAPFFALVTALIMRKQLRRLAATGPNKSFLLTNKALFVVLAVIATVIAALELPPAMTRHGLEMAASRSPQRRAEGIRFLRKFGSKDYLLQSCYNERGRSLSGMTVIGEFFSSESPVKADEARDIYYRVTGETFDSSPAPRSVNGRVVRRNDVEFEEHADGTKTGGILKGLSLTSSNLSGTVDADAGVGHLNWIFTIENASDYAKEIRAEIQLPPGGVVSSVTHWYGGVERKTEFIGRIAVTSAPRSYGDYSDPHPLVLVSTAGRDRIFVRSYAVNGFHTGIKIDIGITMPLVVQSKDEARLILPHFNARNFRVPQNAKHWILIDSPHPLNSDFGLAMQSTARANNKGFQLLGSFSDAALMRPEMALRLSRTDGDYLTWSKNPFEMYGNIVKQTLETRTPSHLRRIVLVVDTSASMAQWQPQITAALRALPDDMDVQMVLADSDWLHETNRENVLAGSVYSAAVLLARTPFVGGADNAPALDLAWNLATATPGNNAVVWIHSPQPIALASMDLLVDRWQGHIDGPALYSVQTSIGSDVIEKKLDGINTVKSVVRLGSLQADLEQLFRQLSGLTPTYEFVRSDRYEAPVLSTESVQTSDQLARLWANDEVARILGAGDNSLREAATMLALRYQLVTPVSGAVIQDINQEFNNGDLEPAPVSSFTTVEEPDFGSLFFLAVIFCVWLIYVKVSKANTAVFIPNGKV